MYLRVFNLSSLLGITINNIFITIKNWNVHVCVLHQYINLCSNLIWQGVVNIEMITIQRSLKTRMFTAVHYFNAKELKAEIMHKST